MELHIGQEIEKQYHKSGLKLSEFAKRLDTSTRNIYSIFARSDINSAQLKKISEVLGFDFFTLYQDTSVSPTGYVLRKKVSVLVELDGRQSTLDEWFNVLKKVNEAL